MQPDNVSKLISRRATVINLVLTVLVFAFFTYYLIDFVPIHEKQNPIYGLIWAAFTSSCISAVFWLAANMFTVVLCDHRQKNKSTHPQP